VVLSTSVDKNYTFWHLLHFRSDVICYVEISLFLRYLGYQQVNKYITITTKGVTR
jgi:hypothetical protein